MSGVVIIGVGNPFRQDDAAGLVVAREISRRSPQIEVIESDGEPVRLMQSWEGHALAVVVDAVVSDDPVGTVHRIELGSGTTDPQLPGATHPPSSHAVGLGEAVALASTLDRLPTRLIVYGITGASFELGEGMSPEVAAATDQVVADALTDLATMLTAG